MSAGKGFTVFVPNNVDLIKFLFNEDIGIVVQVKNQSCIDKIRNKGLNIFKIAQVNNNENVVIKQNNEIILETLLSTLQNSWEYPSYSLEKKQCNLACVEKEYNSNIKYPDKFNFASKTIITDKEEHKGINVAIIREEGSNSDREMAAAFFQAGATVTDVTTSELISGVIDLAKYSGIVFVGGFSFADVMGSGIGWASILKEFY